MTRVVTTVSREGVAFNARHEGKVLRAYRCPAGVITIGFGFTMASRIFAQWWQAKHGRALRLGDTMSEADALMLLEKLMNEEYGRYVAQNIAPRAQHHFDASTSTTFNCGPAATQWRWAQALARGDVAEAARLLRSTATTAGGKQLAGLVRRRADEAHLLETGSYGQSTSAPALTPAAQVRDRLRALGFDGQNDIAAVKAFQQAKGLTVDGLVGPATRAALVRAEEAKRQGQSTAGGAVGGGAVGGGADLVNDPTPTLDTAISVGGGVVVVALFVFAAFMIWRFRGPLFAWLPEGVKDFAQHRLGVTIGRRVAVPA